MSQENVNAHVPSSYLLFDNELNLFSHGEMCWAKTNDAPLRGEPDVPESLYEAGGRDEIQIMIQFDLHSRELKKNKMERRKDEKKITIKKTGIVEGFTFVDLHTKYNLVAELALE